jgi:hypothetical protein
MNVIVYGPLRRKPRYMTPERDAYLRANSSIDPLMLAEDLRLPERYVLAYQRYLGLRKCRNPRDKKHGNM